MRQGLDKYPHRNGHVIKHKKDDFRVTELRFPNFRIRDFEPQEYSTRICEIFTDVIAILSVILVWSWIYQKRMELKVPYYNYYQNCIAAGLLLNILSSTNVMFGRLGMLFTINLIIFIPLLVNSINRHYKLIIMAISIAYCIWNLSNNNATVVPYDSCF